MSQVLSAATCTVRPSISHLPSAPKAQPASCATSKPASPVHSPLSLPSSTISLRSSILARSPLRANATPPTPRPDLLFAIAADDPDAVRRVLADGATDVNESIGPQSALSFAMTNKSLKKRVEIVKTLLAFGANLRKIREDGHNPGRHVDGIEVGNPEIAKQDEGQGVQTTEPERDEHAAAMKDMDLVTRYAEAENLLYMTSVLTRGYRYYVSKAEDPQVQRLTAMIERSTFQPLTQVRYDLIGQDRSLEQLFRVLSMHSQQKHVAPIVVMLCGERQSTSESLSQLYLIN